MMPLTPSPRRTAPISPRRLRKTGPVLITGGDYSEPVGRAMALQMAGMQTPNTPFTPEQMAAHAKVWHPGRYKASVIKIENTLKDPGAQLWIQHDINTYVT